MHTKGFDSFVTSAYYEGVSDFRAALEGAGHSVEFQPNHVAAQCFPDTLEKLAAFDVVILSDIGANTLLIPPDTFTAAVERPNRLRLCGPGCTKAAGWQWWAVTSASRGSKARRTTARLSSLRSCPSSWSWATTREETPQGAPCLKTDLPHPITAELERVAQATGYQRLLAKPAAQVLATIEVWPLLVTGAYGSGRVLAFASDIGPHWVPPGFTEWSGYAKLWGSAASWLAKEIWETMDVTPSPPEGLVQAQRIAISHGRGGGRLYIKKDDTWFRRIM